MIGAELSGRYRVLREIGRGGMGVVYQAHDPLLDRDVAVKVLDPQSMSASATRRFEREARVIAKMDHPSIMNVFDFGRHEGAIFFVMPLARGATMRTMLERGPLDAPTLCRLAIQIADALHYSHRSGIVHRDIKPENIMISGTGDDARAVVTDFGLAVSEGEDRITQSGALVGTTGYLSPEQIRGEEMDSRSDIYSLGVLMYESLVGTLPFEGSVASMLYRIVHTSPEAPHVRNPSIDPELGGIVMWCMERQASRRPRDASQLADALRRIQAGERVAPSSVDQGPTLIGRAREMETVERLLYAARGSEAHLLLVGGEAGIGKTRLIEEIGALCAARGISYREARFLGRDEGFPYQAFCDLLQSYFQSAPAEEVSRAFADRAADLVALFPILREVEPFRDVDVSDAGVKEKSELFELLATAVSRMAHGKLLVLSLEELHSADVSVEALEYLLTRLAPAPLLIVATYRPSELTRKHPLYTLLEEAKRDRRVHLAALRALDRDEQRLLLRQTLGRGEIAGAANERLFAATEGNPFFLHELTRSLVESQALSFDGREWALSADVDFADALPATIQQTVERRIESLDPTARSLLETASIMGRSFDVDALEHLTEGSDVDVHLERLIEEGFLREERGRRGDRLSFSSALMRDISYARIARRRRRQLHRRYAELLEMKNGDTPEKVVADLLLHYAEADDAEKVVQYGLHFARKSLDAFSAGEALYASRLVLDFLEDDEQIETTAHALAAKAQRMLGNVEGALRELDLVYRAAETRGDEGEMLRAAAEATETAWNARRIEEADRWARRGLESGSASADEMRRVLFVAGTLANLRGETEAARLLFERADALESRLSSAPAVVDRGGVIRIPIAGDLLTLDPALGFTLPQVETLSAVFECLTHEAEGVRVAPWLASHIDADRGGRRLRIELRDVRFHDGRRMTAEDVRYSFERLLRCADAESRWMLAPIAGARAYGEGTADEIEGLRVESADRLVIDLQEPVSFFEAVLARLPAAIVPEGSFDIGTGPFRVADFAVSRELRLEASPYYWRSGYPRADGVVFTFGVAPAEIARGLRDGTYDIGWDLLPEDLDELRRDPTFARGFRETPRLSTYYIAFNIHRGPLREEALRREIIDSLNIAKLVASLGAVAVPAKGFIPPGLLGYEPTRLRPALAPQKRSSRVTLQAMLNSAYIGPYAKFASRLFEMFADAGVDIAVTEGKSEYATNQAETLAGADILFTRWIADFPDAHDFIGLLHSETGLVGRMCGTPEIDGLVERGARESNPEVRHQVYRQIEDLLVARALLVPLFHEQSYRFARPEVRDFAINYFFPVVAYDRFWIG